jgi:hypothetical protein
MVLTLMNPYENTDIKTWAKAKLGQSVYVGKSLMVILINNK